jgi:hypothetical protein
MTTYRFCDACEVRFIPNKSKDCPSCGADSFFTSNAEGAEIGLYLYIQETGKDPMKFKEVFYDQPPAE